MSDSEKLVREARKNKKTVEQNLKKVVEEYRKFAESSKKIKLDGIVGLIYNNVFYPLIEELEGFYYIGGETIYMVLKDNCRVYQGNTDVMEIVIDSDPEIVKLGKPPINPIGCPALIKEIPKGMSKFERRL